MFMFVHERANGSCRYLCGDHFRLLSPVGIWRFRDTVGVLCPVCVDSE